MDKFIVNGGVPTAIFTVNEQVLPWEIADTLEVNVLTTGSGLIVKVTVVGGPGHPFVVSVT